MVPPKAEKSALERRVAPRQTVTYRMDVSAADGTLGYLLDVSMNGMRVFFRDVKNLAEIAEIHIDFPRWLELGNGLDVRGRFAWVRPSGAGAEGGFAFDGLSKSERTLLGELVEKLADAVGSSEERS
jgi:hypothetical protein